MRAVKPDEQRNGLSTYLTDAYDYAIVAPCRISRPGDNFMKFARIALIVLLAVAGRAQEPKPVAASAGVLSVAETQRLMPPAVFFQGQLATVQMRNSFGVRFTSGGLVLAGMVDTGGYSSSIRDKYQFYMLSDTAFEIDGKKLSPGSYGCGFGQDGIVVMNLGGNELFHKAVTHDDAMTRPRPLQMQAGKSPDEFRLYLGKDFVTIRP
jgi:hypothetical protein